MLEKAVFAQLLRAVAGVNAFEDGCSGPAD